MNRTSTVMVENDENEQESEGNRWNDEEICSDQVPGVILEKGPPRFGGRFSVPDHVFGHRCVRHLDSNLQQFSVNARSPPQRAVARLICRIRLRTSGDTVGRPWQRRLSSSPSTMQP